MPPTTARRLTRSFFAIGSERLARRLLGQRLVRVLPDGERLSGLIVETEAYVGPKDQASHARNGRRTPRNEAMYAQAGTAYVYSIYGMHVCLNIVCGRLDEPVAVLVRGLEPSEGIERMKEAFPAPRPPHELTRGPAMLCKAMRITKAHNGLDLVNSGELFLEEGRAIANPSIRRTPRIGIDYAGGWALRPLRWLVAGHPSVSGKRGYGKAKMEPADRSIR